MSVATNIAARVQALSATVATEPSAEPSAGAGSASESTDTAPPAVEASGAESAPAADAEAAPDVQKTRHELLAEKLAAVREKRRADRYGERARREASAAETDRKVAAEERAKYEGLKNGTFLETIKALGKDPRVVFEEMKHEAIEAGTPEAQVRRMQEQFNVQLHEAVEPLKQTVEELRKERDELRAREAGLRVQGDFQRVVADEDFLPLRVEYDDERLFAIADNLRQHPDNLIAHARRLQVRLTRDDGRFTMRDILNVLKAQQDEHERGKQERGAKLRPAQQQAAQATADSKTVNGTTDRRIGNPLGNNLASERASGASSKPRLTRNERIQKLIAGG